MVFKAPVPFQESPMSLFDWFKKEKPKGSEPIATTVVRGDSSTATRAFGKTQHPPTGAATRSASAGEEANEQKKHARYMRRELLYGIVRECMIRSGVLSAGYKFKALALDARGLQFIVMVDMAKELGGNADRWSEIDQLIATTAKTRHGIAVMGTYWRLNEAVSLTRSGAPVAEATPAAAPVVPAAAAMPAAAAAATAAVGMTVAERAAAAAAQGRPAGFPAHAAAVRPGAPISRPMPLFPEGPEGDEDDDPLMDLGHAQGASGPVPAPAQAAAQAGGRFESIGDDEVEAFKRALAAGAAASTGAAPAAPVKRPAPVVVPRKPVAVQPAAASNADQNFTLLTGFEDTEAVDPDFAPPALGSTQYGELR
jgi:hypothetical protein